MKTNKMWQTICLLLMGIYATESVVISPNSAGVMLVAEGTDLQLNCTGQSSSTLTWQKDNVQLETGPTGNPKISGIVADTGDNVSILTYSNTGSGQAGIYRCSDDQGIEATVEVTVVKVEITDALFEYHGRSSIACNPVGEVKIAEIVWKKNGTKITDSKKIKDHGNGTLEFLPITSTREDAGQYECDLLVTIDGSATKYPLSHHATLFAKPFVIPFDKSENVVQEEPLDVSCRVLGFPTPNITWFKDKVEIKEDGKRITLRSGHGHPNARLTIENMDFEDGGVYSCMAYATDEAFGTANHSAAITIRVKDKLAALWPFLGIVAEVVILCTIIFIYEKKRNKDAENEDDVNQDGATPEKNKEGVRHRGNTNNPRA